MSLMVILLLGRPTSFLFFVSLFVSIFVPSSSVSTLTIDDVTSKLRPTWLSYDCIHLLIMFVMFFIFKTGAKIALTSTFLKIHQDYIIYCHHLDSLQNLLFPHIKQHCCSTFWHSLFQDEPNKRLRELCQSLHSICAHVWFSVLQMLHFMPSSVPGTVSSSQKSKQNSIGQLSFETTFVPNSKFKASLS